TNLQRPTAIVVSADGSTVWFSDLGDNLIRKLNSGNVTTIAGDGNFAFANGAPATSGSLANPSGIALDSSGNIYVADGLNERVRMITSSGNQLSTIAGSGQFRYGGDGGPATAAYLNDTSSLAFDSSGNLFIGDANNQVVRRVSGGTISTFAGTGVLGTAVSDGAPATTNPLSFPFGVAVRAVDNAVIVGESFYRGRLRTVTNPGGLIGTVSSSGFLGNISMIVMDGAGNYYIGTGNQVFKVPAGGGASTIFAGTGANGYTGDNGDATLATLANVGGLAINAAGDIFISDSGNHVVRMVNHTTNIITTVAGNGSSGNGGDNGPATSATFQNPNGLAVDSTGRIFVADQFSNVVRVFTVGGNIRRIAGTGNFGDGGEGGLAVNATLAGPFALAFDSAGNLYIGEDGNGRVRKVAVPSGGF
ncbi:MAG TPA: hypothetical protein VGF59_21335, partial [Bryobacteraceae bacterium]